MFCRVEQLPRQRAKRATCVVGLTRWNSAFDTHRVEMTQLNRSTSICHIDLLEFTRWRSSVKSSLRFEQGDIQCIVAMDFFDSRSAPWTDTFDSNGVNQPESIMKIAETEWRQCLSSERIRRLSNKDRCSTWLIEQTRRIERIDPRITDGDQWTVQTREIRYTIDSTVVTIVPILNPFQPWRHHAE